MWCVMSVWLWLVCGGVVVCEWYVAWYGGVWYVVVCRGMCGMWCGMGVMCVLCVVCCVRYVVVCGMWRGV